MNVLIVGGSERERREAARAETAAAAVIHLDAATLPFFGPDPFVPPASDDLVIRLDDLHRAFPNNQTRGTRLILTQSTYLLQKLVDRLGDGQPIVATADRAAMERNAPELFFGRGPWRFFDLIELNSNAEPESTVSVAVDDSVIPVISVVNNSVNSVGSVSSVASDSSNIAVRHLIAAYQFESPEDRLRACLEAVRIAPELAAAHLALASACRENQETVEARAALDEAERLAPNWEAVAYESGKFWLAHEDMDRAALEFQRAADLMPTFSAAFGNLGAALGELGKPEAALAAFTRALATDPGSFTVLNNIGVVNRELGRLDDAVAAATKVIEIAPDFVFGHYNLGHALFLAGRFNEALQAYEEGQRLDPEKNRRQGCRLALVRFANGDIEGAARDLWRFADAAPADEREDLLLEAYEIADALMGTSPQLGTHKAFVDRIAAALSTR